MIKFLMACRYRKKCLSNVSYKPARRKQVGSVMWWFTDCKEWDRYGVYQS